MTRPRKQVVDYFPHDAHASDGDTLTILQNHFGNDGYAFWFKLLEKISGSENHVIDCRNAKKWQLLLAKTCTNQETGAAIMAMLCELQAIDAELWYGHKIIWCQKLVDNVADVYKHRGTPIPERPVITPENAISADNNLISVPDNPQSKVKYTKVKYSKVKGKEISIPDFIDKELWHDFLEMRKQMRKPATPRAQELLIKDLVKLSADGDDPNEIIKQSIKNSWQGLFPVGGRDGTHRAKSRALPTKYTRPEDLR